MTLEWRKYLAEFVGTFTLTFAGTGAIVIEAITHKVGNLGIALTFGLVVMVMIYAFGEISGAHINPAVTAGFVVAGHFPIGQLLWYWSAQLLGAVAASSLILAFFGNIAALGATIPRGPEWVSFVLEIILAFLLMVVIMAVATGTKELGGMTAIAVGGTIAMEAIFAGPISGASMNPARSIGPALVGGRPEFLWLYITAPMIGTTLGALFYGLVSNSANGRSPRASK